MGYLADVLHYCETSLTNAIAVNFVYSKGFAIVT